jgi:thiamine-phosphate pyrophosphorylase
MEFSLYLITDRKSTAGEHSIDYVLQDAFEAGVRAVLLRERDLPDRDLIALAGRIRDLSLKYNVRMLVSGRVDIAIAVGADGLHLTSSSLPANAARKLVGKDKYIAVSTHSLAEAKRAEAEGANFITYGPVYYTPSKARYGPPAGLENLAQVCGQVNIPVFALGGVTEDNALDAMDAGAYGVAVISAVIGAEHPAAAAAGIINKIRCYKIGRLV